MPYRLLLPNPFDPARAYPALLFFHGAGDRGDDNIAQLRNVLHRFTHPDLRAQYPCIIIAPQCPADGQWVEAYTMNHLHRLTRPADAGEQMRLALEILAVVEQQYRPARLYISGLSMGGFAAWDCLTRFPEKLAAVIPICGGGDPATVTPAAARVPVWAFHSADDPWVEVQRTRDMVAALRQAGGAPRYTEYTHHAHASWEPAYAEPELLPWLFSQSGSPAREQIPLSKRGICSRRGMAGEVCLGASVNK
jgi:predicted peptidase